MNTKLATRQIRLNEWAAVIKDCKASGLKVDTYPDWSWSQDCLWVRQRE